MDFLSGFIAIIGPPNVGKSTLLNRFIGKKIAITSPKPQTTRNRIVGIYNDDSCQMVFVDTPGIHHARSLLHKSMISSAEASVAEVDLVVLVAGSRETEIDREEMDIIFRLVNKRNKPLVLAINKIDLVKKENLLPVMEAYSRRCHFDAIVPISALHGDGIDVLMGELKCRLQVGPRYFPSDIVTDKPEEFLIAETIREKIYYATSEELPYSSAVVVESLREEKERNVFVVGAVIFVERESQKAMIIGKGGRMIKRIGQDARLEIERIFSVKVYLDLVVRVKKKWSGDVKSLRKLGY